jgi:hypothetical protein
MFKSFIQIFHQFFIIKPNIIAKEAPNKLTINGENLLRLVITIGNSSFRIVFCKTKPIITLKNNKSIRGHLKFQSPSWDLLKFVMLLCGLLKKVKLVNLNE